MKRRLNRGAKRSICYLMIGMLLTQPVQKLGYVHNNVSNVEAATEDERALGLLGINEERPAQYNEDTSPYGRETIEIMPLSELYINASSVLNYEGAYKELDTKLKKTGLYYDDNLKDQTGSISPISKNWIVCKSVSGKYGNNDLKSQLSTVYGEVTGSDLSISIEVKNPLDEEKVILDTFTDLKIDSNDDFSGDNAYLLQQYMAIESGDIDGDGLDEIAVYIPNSSGPMIYIYRLREEGNVYEKDSWETMFTIPISNYGRVPNQVSLNMNDMSYDGVDDLLIAYGRIGDIECASQFVFYEGKKNVGFQEAIDFNVDSNGYDLYRCSTTFGDVDGNGKKEIVVSGELANDKGIFISSNIYDSDSHTFVNTAKTITDKTCNNNLKLLPVNLTIAKLEEATPNFVYIDGMVFAFRSGKFEAVYTSDTKEYDYVEYGATAANFGLEEDTTQSIIICRYYPHSNLSHYELHQLSISDEDVMGLVAEEPVAPLAPSIIQPIHIEPEVNNVPQEAADEKEEKTVFQPNEHIEDEIDLEEKVKPEDKLELEEEVSPEDKLESEEEVSPEDKIESEEEVSPEDEIESEKEVSPEDKIKSEEEVSPKDEIESEKEVIPEDKIESEKEVIPEDKIESEEEVSPEDKIESEQEVSPEDKIESEEEVSPEDKIESEEEVIPEDKIESEEEVIPEDEISSEEEVTPEDKIEEVMMLATTTEINKQEEEESQLIKLQNNRLCYTKELLLFAFPNTDRDTVILKYTGKSYYKYKDPEILAVIASPPYFKELEHLDGGDDYVGNSTTSYVKTSGSGSGGSSSHTFSVGAYLSYEKEFRVPIIHKKVAGFEIETEVTYNRTKEVEKITTETEDIEFGTAAGQDSVAIYSIPVVEYIYELYVPVENGDEYIVSKSVCTVPHKPVIKVVSLDRYKEVQSAFSYLPKIADNLLSHEVGKPETYPNTVKAYPDAVASNEPWLGIGDTPNSFISRTVSVENEKATTVTQGVAVSAKAGASIGDFTVGIVGGYEYGNGDVVIDMNGHSFTTVLHGMPEIARNYGYDYAVQMVRYSGEYSKGEDKVRFPIISYAVKDVSAPPAFPEEVEVESNENSVTLSWEADNKATSYNVYKQFSSNEGEEDVLIGVVENDNFSQCTFMDKQVEASTEYSYCIQAVNAFTRSVKGPQIKAITSLNNIEINFHIDGTQIENKVIISTDESSTIKAEIIGINDGNTVVYQWQRYEKGEWVKIIGQDRKNYNFTTPSIRDNGYYRLKIGQVKGSKLLTTYSPQFEVKVEKKDMQIKEVEVTDKTISIPLESTDTSFKPSGHLVVQIKREGYSTIHNVEIIQNKAEITDFNIENGLYEVIINYPGDHVFNSLENKQLLLIGDVEGNFIRLQKKNHGWEESVEFYYGDVIRPELVTYPNMGKDVQSDSISYYKWTRKEKKFWFIVYKIYYEWEKVDSNEVSPAGEFTPEEVGKYKVEVHMTGNKVSKEFSVSKIPITITAPSLKGPSDQAYTLDNLKDINLGEQKFVNEDTFESLGIEYACYDRSGNSVLSFGDTEVLLPGSYETSILFKNNSNYQGRRNNYSIQTLNGDYRIYGAIYTLDVENIEVNNNEAGYVTFTSSEAAVEDGKYLQNTEFIFTAHPYLGYEVEKWRVIEGESNEKFLCHETNKNVLKYKMPGKTVRIAPIYKVKETTVTYNEKDEKGFVTCSAMDLDISSGTVVSQNTPLLFTAKPAPGYSFKEWYMDSGETQQVLVGETLEDGSNGLSYTMGEYALQISAVFQRDSYKVTYDTGLNCHYSVDGSTVSLETGKSIIGDTKIIATPVKGKQVSNWYVNGVQAGNDQELRLTVTEDIHLSADLIAGQYTLTCYESQNSGNRIRVKIANTEAFIWEQNMEPLVIEGGTKVQLSPVESDGYIFKEWSTSECLASYITVADDLVINHIDGDVKVGAVFEANKDYRIYLPNLKHADLKVYRNSKESNIEFMDNKHQVKAFENDDIVIKVVPHKGYMVEYWDVNGHKNYTNENQLSIDHISDHQHINIRLVPLVHYPLVFEVDDDNQAQLNILLDDEAANIFSGELIGGGTKVTLKANTTLDFMVSYWELDGLKVMEDGYIYVDDEYTISAIENATSLRLVTEPKESYMFRLADDSSSNGTLQVSIVPDFFSVGSTLGPWEIRKGAQVLLSINANNGHEVSKVEVNNTEVQEESDGLYRILMDDNKELRITTKELHQVEIVECINGTCHINKNAFVQGSQVLVKAIADEDYVFSHWETESNILDDGDELSNEIQFIMPAEKVFLKPIFKVKSYMLKEGNTAFGEVKLIKNNYSPGETVEVEALPNTGYRFVIWKASPAVSFMDEHHIKTSFIMPASDITLMPTFEKIPSPNPGGGSGGGGGGGTPSSPPKKKDNSYVNVNEALTNGKVNKEGILQAQVELDKNDHNTYAIDIPKSFAKTKQKKELTLVTPNVTVIVPNDAFDSLPIGDINIEIKELERKHLPNNLNLNLENKPIIDIEIKQKGKVVHWQNSENKIKLRVPYTLSQDEEKHLLVMVYVADNGQVEYLPSSYYDTENKEMVFQIHHTSKYALSYIGKSFEDIMNYKGEKEAIEALAARGVIYGKTDTSFDPEADVTRAEFITMLMRYMGMDKISTSSNFSDINKNAYYYNAVGVAKELGLVSGTGDNAFDPDSSITREDMMVILYRMLAYEGVLKKDKVDPSIIDYIDEGSISAYAYESVNYMVSMGIERGKDKKIQPKVNAKRYEIAQLLYELLKMQNQ